jgi:hypothetical protein
MTRYGIYEVEEEYNADGSWKGYRCSATSSVGKQGKLYPKSDGRENYKAKKEEELDL